MSILLEIKNAIWRALQRLLHKKQNTQSAAADFEFAKNQPEDDIRSNKYSISQSETQKLLEIKGFIENNLKSFYTIEQLSLKFRINEFKLKNGFKRAIRGWGVSLCIQTQDERSPLFT